MRMLQMWTGLALIGVVLGGAPAKAADQAPTMTARPSATATAGTIDLNTATAAELDTLPGIGAATAARILEYRQKQGGFKKIEELMNIRGIGEKNFLKLKPLIRVGPASEAGRAGSAR